MKTIRCSSLDSLFGCTPSVLGQPTAITIKTTGPEAEVGKLAHSLAASYIETGTFDLDGECDKQGFTGKRESIAAAMSYAVQAWRDLSPLFHQPRTEVQVDSKEIRVGLEDYKLEGTIDLLSPSQINEVSAYFLDWKTGWGGEDGSYAKQMIGYAYCIWSVLGKPENCTIVGFIVFLHQRRKREIHYTTNDLREFEYDLAHNVLSKPDVFRPGEQCPRCPRYLPTIRTARRSSQRSGCWAD
jgi:hypothetical protein